MSNLHVYSEIGQLKKVMLHRPGEELLNLSPGILGSLLFDDIPFLEVAQQEHDAFAQALRNEGVEVLYMVDLVAEALDSHEGAREEFFNAWLAEAALGSMYVEDAVREYMSAITDTREFVSKCITGMRRGELDLHPEGATPLADRMGEGNDSSKWIVVRPMPNAYFTRDAFSVVGHSVSMSTMSAPVRQREPLFGEFIFKYHPVYGGTSHIYDRGANFSLEGGDIMVSSQRKMLVGVSQRTRAAAIDEMASRVFYSGDETSFEEIIVLAIPVSRSFMHLDTVLTQVDYDKFTVHPSLAGRMQGFKMVRGANGTIDVHLMDGRLEDILAETVGLDSVSIIKCGGDDPTAAAREQWSDGSNTLCVSPGKVCVYHRNTATNEALTSNGIECIVIPSAELSRGRGGPRCMSMPFVRED